jgi:DNA-binding NarL/FixJ family response regulator
MDVSMPFLSGLDATRLIVSETPDMKILILSVHEQSDVLFGALLAGAIGYVNKAAHTETFLRFVRQALAGNIVLSPEMVTNLAYEYRRLARLLPASSESDAGATDLTSREEAVLALIASGATNAEIAEELSISVHTVKSHVQNLLRKLGVSSRREAAQIARKMNL